MRKLLPLTSVGESMHTLSFSGIWPGGVITLVGRFLTSPVAIDGKDEVKCILFLIRDWITIKTRRFYNFLNIDTTFRLDNVFLELS